MQDQIIVAMLIIGAYITGRVIALRESAHQVDDYDKLKNDYRSLQRSHNDLIITLWEDSKKEKEKEQEQENYYNQFEEDFLRDIYGNVTGTKEDTHN